MSKVNFKSAVPTFEVYKNLVYLDNAATTQKPAQVLDAVERYYREENANPLRGLYDLSVKATDAYENAREAVRRFIGAKSTKEIVFTRNATESLNLIAYSWGNANIAEEDEILIAVSEHHSNLLPWQILANKTGAKLNYLECDEHGGYSVESLKNALTPKTKLFAIAQVSNVFGRINPIREFADICHKNGTVIICDGAQSVPHMAVDVVDLGVDFLAFSGHKLYAPMGIGVLYGREELLDKMPPFLYGGEMIDVVKKYSATFAELPHKFEAGTVNVGGAVGLGEAIRFMKRFGWDTIEKREEELTTYAMEKMAAYPHVHIIGSKDPKEHHGIITFTVDDVHPHDCAAIFDEHNVAVRAGHHCAQPLLKYLGKMSTVRASMAFYNDKSDIDAFYDALISIRKEMGYAD